MTERYHDFLKRLYGLTRFGEKFDLSGPRELQRFLGWPLQDYPSILIGGTNGKGSTCKFLEHGLRALGLRTGLFTSPHLNFFSERIQVDGQPVSDDWLANEGLRLIDWAEANGVSFFEAAWGLASCAFREMNADVVIWEVGLGGRLDATNVAAPVASAITNIALDHTQVLGDTLEAIAREKSAIFRPDKPALTAAHGAGLRALQTVIEQHVTVVDPLPSDVELSLSGMHQRRNAALALEVGRALGHPLEAEHLSGTCWPGRCEQIESFLLDVAHNPAALETLSEWVRANRGSDVNVIFGAMQDKDLRQMAHLIESFADTITLVTPDYPRRIAADQLATYFSQPVQICDSVADAIDGCRDRLATVVCGSSFLVAEARAHLLGIEYPEFGIRTTAR